MADSRISLLHKSGRTFESLRSAIRTDHWQNGGRHVNGETFPPFLGEHSLELLEEIGYEKKDVQAMTEKGEVVQWDGIG